MTKSELIEKIALNYPKLSNAQISDIVNQIFDSIESALSRGNRVEVRGFGSFGLKKRKSRIARNPKTGESVEVNEKNVPFFRPGKIIRESVKQIKSR